MVSGKERPNDREPNRFVFPAPILKKISSRITNEVAGINRVTYDISSKPPAVSNLSCYHILSLPVCVLPPFLLLHSGILSAPQLYWSNGIGQCTDENPSRRSSGFKRGADARIDFRGRGSVCIFGMFISVRVFQWVAYG